KSTIVNPARARPPVIPDHELLQRIGCGAYGEVWMVRNVATGVLRAAKVVYRDTFTEERPFAREFEGIRAFEEVSRSHASQLASFHVGRNTAEGYFYYLMELADNAAAGGSNALNPNQYAPRTLRRELEAGRLAAARVLEIGLALTEA